MDVVASVDEEECRKSDDISAETEHHSTTYR
jgi:hypothetical protein